MYCPNCGAQMSDKAAFCAKCGTPLKARSTGKPSEQKRTVVLTEPLETTAPVKKGLPVKLLAVAVGIGIVAIVLAVILLSGPKTVHLEDAVTVKFSGYNTVGQAAVSLDLEKFDSQLAKAMEESEAALTASDRYRICREAVQLSVEPEDGLSNGDEVTVQITYDNDAVADFEIQFSGEIATFTVEGLEDLVEVDPFDGLSVAFSGIAPDGAVGFSYDGTVAYINSLQFTCDKTHGLRNGDTVTVSIEGYQESASIYSGYRLTQTSKEYTVEGLDEYVDNYTDLPEEFLTYAKQESEDLIHAYVAKDYDDESALGDLAYAGYVFNAVKPDKRADNYNELYLLYRGMVSHVERDFHDTMVYFPVRFENLLSVGGELEFEVDEDIAGWSSLHQGYPSYSTRGYSNPLTAYEELIVAQQDDYTCTAGDGFEKYASYTPISTIADIRPEDLQALNNLAADEITTYITNDYADTSYASERTFVGQYLLTAKSQGSDYRDNNRLILVFSATVSSSTGRFAPATVYFPVQFEGLINLPGEEFMYVEGGEIQGRTRFPDSLSYTDGYLDGREMFKELVTANLDSYSYEVSDGLKVFGE